MFVCVCVCVLLRCVRDFTLLQVGFFKALVCPLYAMLAAVAPGCKDLHSELNRNLDFWTEHPRHPPSSLLRLSNVGDGDGEDLNCHLLLGPSLK